MRIRLTIDIERSRGDSTTIEPERDVEMGSLVERQPQQRIGFTAAPGRTHDPDEWDGHR